MHQVVDLGAGADARFPHRRAIDRGAATHLDAVLQHHLAGLGHLAPTTGGGHETEPLRSDHRTGMHHTAPAQPAARLQHGMGMHLTALGELHVVIEHDPRMEDAAVADHGGGTHHGVSTHMHAGADPGGGIDHRGGMDAGLRTDAGMESVEGFGEGEPGILQGHPGQAPLRGLLLQGFVAGEEHGGSPRFGQGGGEAAAALQEAELALAGQVDRLGTVDLRIGAQMAGGCRVHRAEVAEQAAEAHGPGAGGRIVGPMGFALVRPARRGASVVRGRSGRVPPG